MEIFLSHASLLQYQRKDGNVKTVVEIAETQSLTNKTLVSPVFTGIVGFPAPVTDTTGTVTVTQAALNNVTLVIKKVSGGTVQLPLASGSGAVYRVVVGLALTSAQWIISAVVATDVFAGGILINDTGASAAATADFYPTAATSNTITMTLATSGGGSIGDWVEFEDISANTWAVRGVFQGTIDPVTPFSHV